MNNQEKTLYRIKNLEKYYLNKPKLNSNNRESGHKKIIFSNVNLEIYSGSFVVFQGPSGVGKSTLLNLMGLLDSPSSGEIWFDGAPLGELSPENKTEIRRESIGFIFQFHHLFQELTTEENIMVPLLLQGKEENVAKSRALELMEKLGIKEQKGKKPANLSGGEKQRVAIARAVIHRPKVVIGDEITGNLDEGTSQIVIEYLLNLLGTHYSTLIIATHDRVIADRAERRLIIEKGEIREGGK